MLLENFSQQVGAGLLAVIVLCPLSLSQVRPSAPSVPGPELLVKETPRRRSLDRPAAYGARNLRIVQPPDVAALRVEEDSGLASPNRSGVVLEFPTADTSARNWIALDDGGWLWVQAYRAHGARALRLRVREWQPPQGAQLTLHSADDTEARGPLDETFRSKSNTLWTYSIHADHVRIEYYLPPSADHEDPSNQVRVDAVLYQYRGFSQNPSQEGAGGGGSPLPCHLDWSCYSLWENTGEGVCALNFIGDGFGFFCSGALLNRIPGDFAPLLMTATHCGISDGNADTLEATWFWQTSSCGGSAPSISGLPVTMGSTVLVSDDTTDWTLVGLEDDIPSGVTYLGFDASTVSNGTSVVGIHHPDGSWKRISFGSKISNNGVRPTPGTLDCENGSAHKIDWPSGSGLTEGGSSGSPLLISASHLVVGVDSCGYGRGCAGDNQTAYGRLDQAYPLLEPYLNPTDPIFANQAWAGAELGNPAFPFDSITEASFAVIDGSDIYALAGTYNEALHIDRAMTIQSVGGDVVIR